ncbi:hypothetical protein WJX73_000551 [Symbiochloris irregularis]|uniref:Uncharacterized protein n=1 Tax=Symbiochloris irregularis TaxID=706552 RepID=A0AAW1PU90_9CHLO
MYRAHSIRNLSYQGPACVIVTPGLSASDCQKQATADQLTFVSTDSGCAYPVASDCSSFPAVKACTGTTSDSITAAGKSGTFDSALVSNKGSPPLAIIQAPGPPTSGSSDSSEFGTGNAVSGPGSPNGK